MIKLKVFELVSANTVFSKISNTEMPISLSLKIARTIKVLSEEMKTVYEQQNKLAEKYGKRGTDGQIVFDEAKQVVPIKDECLKDFSKDNNALMTTECEINIEPLDIALFEDIKLTPKDLIAITPFIKE